jgi:phosphoglycerate dehydrogenase-like enzyme
MKGAANDERPRVAVVDCALEDELLLERLRRTVPTRVVLGPAEPADLIERAAGAEVLITLYTYTQVTAAALEALPELRLVATRTSGYSHNDVAAAAKRGVAVAVVPAAATEAVAEFVFGTAIALGRRLFEARESTRSGQWEYLGFRGLELAGRTLGVVGLGSIGTRVAELGNAFGMRVLGWSRRRKELPWVEQTTLEDLLTRADVVSVSVAFTPDTQSLLDDERLALMKPTAIVVNTARGGIVDDKALCRRLEAGLLGGACLDVFSIEPPGEAQLEQLARVPNLLVTPHIAWHTPETLARQFGGMTDNVLTFLEGRPRNLVREESVVD